MAVKKVSELKEIKADSLKTGDLSDSIYFLAINTQFDSQFSYTSNKIKLASIDNLIQTNYVNNLQNNITSITTQINDIDGELNQITSNIDAIDTNVTDNYNKFIQLNDNNNIFHDSIKKTIIGNDGNITDITTPLQTQINNITSDIDSINDLIYIENESSPISIKDKLLNFIGTQSDKNELIDNNIISINNIKTEIGTINSNITSINNTLTNTIDNKTVANESTLGLIKIGGVSTELKDKILIVPVSLNSEDKAIVSLDMDYFKTSTTNLNQDQTDFINNGINILGSKYTNYTTLNNNVNKYDVQLNGRGKLYANDNTKYVAVKVFNTTNNNFDFYICKDFKEIDDTITYKFDKATVINAKSIDLENKTYESNEGNIITLNSNNEFNVIKCNNTDNEDNDIYYCVESNILNNDTQIILRRYLVIYNAKFETITSDEVDFTSCTIFNSSCLNDVIIEHSNDIIDINEDIANINNDINIQEEQGSISIKDKLLAFIATQEKEINELKQNISTLQEEINKLKNNV